MRPIRGYYEGIMSPYGEVTTLVPLYSKWKMSEMLLLQAEERASV